MKKKMIITFEVAKNYEFHPENFDTVGNFANRLLTAVLDECLAGAEDVVGELESYDISDTMLLTNTKYSVEAWVYLKNMDFTISTRYVEERFENPSITDLEIEFK